MAKQKGEKWHRKKGEGGLKVNGDELEEPMKQNTNIMQFNPCFQRNSNSSSFSSPLSSISIASPYM